MEWLYEGKQFDHELDHKAIYGFVYLITNKLNGRKYIGKKFFWSKGHRMVNKKRKRILKESDWKKYFGSNKPLQEDVKKYGPENFEREILHLCSSKSECAYLEAYEQFVRHVLMDDNYYNEWISFKLASKHLGSLKEKLCY